MTAHNAQARGFLTGPLDHQRWTIETCGRKSGNQGGPRADWCEVLPDACRTLDDGERRKLAHERGSSEREPPMPGRVHLVDDDARVWTADGVAELLNGGRTLSWRARLSRHAFTSS